MRPVATESQDDKVKVWAVATPREALVWLLDPAMDWPAGAMVDPPPAVVGAKISVAGLEDGVYAIEWWDTLAGQPVARNEARCQGGRLSTSAPDFRVDLAARVRRR